jgi:hypothetical protein
VYPLAVGLAIDQRSVPWVASGAFESPLTALGIRPFRALLGAIKLSDWVRLRVRALLQPA